MTELKNCPFCGEHANIEPDGGCHDDIGCHDPDCAGHSACVHYHGDSENERQKAIALWSRRADGWVRYKRYKPNSQQAKSGILGRWQEFNGFGWINCDEPVKWMPELK